MRLRKFGRFFFSRLVIVSLLILLQLGLFTASMVFLSVSTRPFRAVMGIVSLLVALWIVNKRDNPSYKLAWVVLILTAPLVGGAFYLL